MSLPATCGGSIWSFGSARLQIPRFQTGMLRNAREHFWTNLVAVVKGEDHVRVTWP